MSLPATKLVPRTLAQGSLETLDLEEINKYYDEGDICELQLFLRDNIDRDEAEEAVVALEMDLFRKGVLPWPGQTRLLFLDWENRTVHYYWQQGFPGLLAIAFFLIVFLSAAFFIWSLLDPDRAWKAIEWIKEAAAELLEDIWKPLAALALIGGGGLVLYAAAKKPDKVVTHG